jgi:hypothetical protein
VSSKRRIQRNRRSRDIRVVARGVRRPDPDITRITQASLDFFLTTRDTSPTGSGEGREGSTKGGGRGAA